MSTTRLSNLSVVKTQLFATQFAPYYVPSRRAYTQFHKERRFATSCASHQDVFHAQAEDPLSSAFLGHPQTSPQIPQTLTEKIVQKSSVGLAEGKKVKSGDYVFLKPSKVMTHDNSWPVALKFMSIGASKVHDPTQLVMTLDHDVQNQSDANLKKYRQIEAFAKAQGVDFYGAGRGIGHQIMIEEGYCWPNEVCVASDSHSNMYGALGVLGTPVVRTDAASLWSTGRTWWQIPPIAKVTFKGILAPGVTGKDVIVALCGLFNNDEVLNHAIEFSGSEETLKSLSIDSRLALANMTTEWGALRFYHPEPANLHFEPNDTNSGLFPVDSVLIAYLRYKATNAALSKTWNVTDSTAHLRFTHERIDALVQDPVLPERGAKYQKELYLDLSSLSPYVSGPNSVKLARPLDQLESEVIRIDKAYLVSCTNSRASDIAAAAKVFKEAAKINNSTVPKVPDHVQFYIAAASLPEQRIAEEAGDWQTLIEAGAIPLPCGCGPCIGLGRGLLEKGEVGISASNRNFKGRMGSVEAQAYLSSPEVVAASALNGKISGPGWYKRPDGVVGVLRGEGDGIREADRMVRIEDALEDIINQADEVIAVAEKDGIQSTDSSVSMTKESDRKSTEILLGFPEKIEGEILFCDADNINTDSIYPGKYTYQDNVSPEMMATVCMENYDPSFSSIAQEGDILVCGYNMGCGSSREQAATAILAKKLPLVVAGSFGNIFSRNSINNALLGLELPGLIKLLRDQFPQHMKSNAPKASSSVTEPDHNKESLDSPPPAPVQKPTSEKKVLTRRTGFRLLWDVRRSLVEVRDGEKRVIFQETVGEMPPNVQEIIACGGLENWVKKVIGK